MSVSKIFFKTSEPLSSARFFGVVSEETTIFPAGHEPTKKVVTQCECWTLEEDMADLLVALLTKHEQESQQ